MISGRLCVCGVPIPESHVLCRACQKIYTLRRRLWPEWLHEWMKNYQVEIDYERSRPASLDEIMSRQARVDNGGLKRGERRALERRLETAAKAVLGV